MLLQDQGVCIFELRSHTAVKVSSFLYLMNFSCKLFALLKKLLLVNTFVS